MCWRGLPGVTTTTVPPSAPAGRSGACPRQGRSALRPRRGCEILGRIPLHELHSLLHLVLGRGNAHQSTPAIDDHGIRLGLVRRDPERDQRGRLAPTRRAHVDVYAPRGRDAHLADGGLLTI